MIYFCYFTPYTTIFFKTGNSTGTKSDPKSPLRLFGVTMTKIVLAIRT